MKINIILFPDFETLDVFGPVEIFGKVENWQIGYYSQKGGTISNSDNITIHTEPIQKIINNGKDILFVPGGMGTRKEIDNTVFLNILKQLSENSLYTLSVCTGSALLAKAGILDGKKATSNKRAFDWVKSTSSAVEWIKEARWINDGKYYTSSGVSAGIDMALGFVSDICDISTARQIARRIEYKWNEDRFCDEF